MVSAAVDGEIPALNNSHAWETHWPTGGRLGPCSRWDEWCRGADALWAILLEAE